jgi:O-antigen ligase
MRYKEQLEDYEPVTRSSATPKLVDTSFDHGAPDVESSVASKVEIERPSSGSLTIGQKLSTLKRGHMITYAGLFLFTIVLYFRPYEYFSSAEWLQTSASWIAIITLIIFFPTQLALEGNLMTRPREVNLVLIFCVAGLLSIPFATSPLEAWDTFNTVFLKAVLIFIVIVNVVRTRRRLWGLFFLTIAVSCLLSVNALSDYHSGKVVVEGYRVMGSIGGMFANPNDLAMHLVTVLPIAIALGLSSRNIVLKVVYWAVGTLLVATVTVTYSRGGFLALLAVVTVLSWKLGRSKRWTVLLLLIFGVVLFVSLAPGNYGLRLASIFIPGLDPNGSRTARQDLLQRSIMVALRYPIFGVGMGNFHHRGFQELGTHNAYTQVASEMGLFACFIYIKFLVGPLRRLRVIEALTFPTRKGSRHYYLAVGLQASLIGFMVASFFASVAYHWYVYYLVGYAVCFRRMYEAETNTDVEAVLRSRKAEKTKKGSAQGIELTPVRTGGSR